MDSSLFNDEESPILSKPIKRLNYSNSDNQYLEQIHNRLLRHLKKKENIPRAELKMYLEKTNKMNPECVKTKWFLMKIRGLLNFILKKRCDFQGSLLKGEITILDKSLSQPDCTVRDVPEPPKFYSQPYTDVSMFSLNILTNNDFVTIDSNRETNGYNHSQDLFSDSISALHQMSQENASFLKSITKSPVSNPETAVDSKTKINEVFEAHDYVEKKYSEILSVSTEPHLPESSTQETNNKTETANVFDNLTISNEELTEEFEELVKQTEPWIEGIVNNLIHLELKDPPSFSDIQFEESQRGEKVLRHHSEENLKIIREVQNEFKKKLEDFMQDEDKVDVMRCLFGTDGLSD